LRPQQPLTLSIMPTKNSTATKIPKDGWVQELEDAESAAKRSRSAGAQLRLAIAAYNLRDFKKLKISANLGLALDPSEGEKELLKEYAEKSKEQKEKEIMLDRNSLQKLHEPGVDCDVLTISSRATSFTNLNILQYAVATGDVTLMEEVVGLGAALDFPVADENAPGIPPAPAPPGSTALLLACAIVAMYGEMERRDPNFRRAMPAQVFDTIDRNCECAIRLVHLGANCQVKLKIPVQRRNAPVNPDDPTHTFRMLKLGGKTAQQLASMSRRRDLIRAMELMQKPENVHLTQCRCGSRLPWNQCHGAPVPGQSDLKVEHDKRWRWRFSPKASCPCKLTKKEYYKCCWFSASPYYMDDASGELVKVVKAPVDGTTSQLLQQALHQLQQVRISEGMDPNGPIVPQDMTTDELRSKQSEMIRTLGLSFASDFNGRRSGVKDWDPIVFAGVVERIDNYFMWNDLHWQLDKAELLQRTKEWNEALEKYCDETGLTGVEREAVVQKHTANPCAPCANASCNNWETEPKEFKKCSRCKMVAYCSGDCQKKNWKAQHKKTCFAN
jgi:hypothetical protein